MADPSSPRSSSARSSSSGSSGRSNPLRYGTLWCPHWPVVAAGGPADEPLAVVHANRVVAHSTAAGAAGVAIGQRRREAQGRCPQLHIVGSEPAREAREYEPVVLAVGALVPRLEVAEPGMLTFAARGPSRYFGGDETMAARVAAEADAVAPNVRIAVGGFGMGIADGRFTAAVAARRSARHGVAVVVPAGPEATAAFLAPLPVHLLTTVAGLDVDFVHLLARLGIRRLGDLAALPPAEVLARFGRPGAFAVTVAGGGDDRPPGTQDPPTGCRLEHPFEEPVHETDTLVFVARQLAGELAARLAADGRVCTRLVVTAETDHGERSERVWHRPDGLGVAAMVERVRWQLDAWVQQDAITAGVVLLRLEPDEVRSDEGVQLGLWGGRTQADEWAARAVARLATLAGEQQVLVPTVAGGRQPGDAYRWEPAILTDLTDPARTGERPGRGDGPWPGQLPTPSPAVVHPQPTPVTVLAADGGAVRVTGRGWLSDAPATVQLDGRAEVIVGWAGPWPVEERWWDTSRARRSARFQLLTASGRLLLAAIERQQWCLVAEYA
ncbi:MAG: DNA polymerase Y family protein [Ilumatobacteraceae bacterium]